ncbi:hypothetical protein DFH11DRAFT_312219 [Phellopilus nigrolimitatus]|nr:hypothetical protein DFH11DRAFT_312219 [Phellopilus nigrolimitatus]
MYKLDIPEMKQRLLALFWLVQSSTVLWSTGHRGQLGSSAPPALTVFFFRLLTPGAQLDRLSTFSLHPTMEDVVRKANCRIVTKIQQCS